MWDSFLEHCPFLKAWLMVPAPASVPLPSPCHASNALAAHVQCINGPISSTFQLYPESDCFLTPPPLPSYISEPSASLDTLKITCGMQNNG